MPQIVTLPTRKSNLIDLIFTNLSHLVHNINIIDPILNSDHNAIELNININPPTVNAKNFFYTDFKNGNYDELNNYLLNINWNQIFLNRNIDEMYKNFIQIITHGISLYIPIKIINQKKKFLPLHIRNLLKYKRKLWKKIYYPAVHHKYQIITKKLNHQILKYRKNCENRLINSNIDLYKYVKRNLKSNTAINQILVNNNYITNRNEIANCFLNYFYNVFNFAPPVNINNNQEICPINQNSSDLIFTPDSAVYDAICKMSPSINYSPDSLNNFIIKKYSIALTRPISMLLRQSFLVSKVPELWKTAYIVPILKSSNTYDISNFRPISLTSPIAKIAENFIKCKLESYIYANNILPKFQHGFHPRRSVQTCLTEQLDDWTNCLDNKQNCDIALFDLQKAFDYVHHKNLLFKLYSIGIPHDIVKWIEFFLTNRKFAINISGKNSTYSKPYNRGVPQGSILGPILFNLYIYDIKFLPINDKIKIKGYADDTKAYIIYDTLNAKTAQIELQDFINKFVDWCKINGLSVSKTKTKLFYIGNNNPKHFYKIDDEVIPKANDIVRDLGLFITPNLKWDEHIKIITKKAFKKWFMLYKFFKTNNEQIMIKLYVTYIRPILEFNCMLFNNQSIKLNNLLETIQKRITRMIFRRCFVTDPISEIPNYETRLNKLCLHTLAFRRNILELSYFYSIHNGKLDISKTNWPCLKDSTTRGHRSKYLRPHVRTNIRSKFFTVRTPKVFNALPDNIANNKIIKNINKTLTNYFINLNE